MNQIALSTPSSLTVNQANLAIPIIDQLGRIVKHLELWRQQQKSSMQCARVDGHILRDIGISEAQRFIEVNKLS